jgi:hypothetical protein
MSRGQFIARTSRFLCAAAAALLVAGCVAEVEDPEEEATAEVGAAATTAPGATEAATEAVTEAVTEDAPQAPPVAGTPVAGTPAPRRVVKKQVREMVESPNTFYDPPPHPWKRR